MKITLYEQAADFISQWEGFCARAYWDINHWRIGFGSDTEGPNDKPVERHTVTTHERALQNLQLRIGEFRYVVLRDIGAAAWALLNQNQQVALIDICYNYGHVPIQVDARNAELTANRLIARGRDNNGINAKRRRAEAMLYMKPPETTLEKVEEFFEDIAKGDK